jgi:hypothetical protein
MTTNTRSRAHSRTQGLSGRFEFPLSFSFLFAAAFCALLSVGAEAANNVMRYSIDKVGNVTNAQRAVPAGLFVNAFTPSSGPIGVAVTITGSGFSPVAGDNLVKFNGTTASVSAASATSLAVTVPTGATTGTISVTVSGATANSAAAFTVTPALPPTIAGFTPDRGVAGTPIVVTGTNFDTSAAGTTVNLGAAFAPATVSSATALTFSIPGGTGSAPFTINTAAGSVRSNIPIVVAPAGYLAEDFTSSAHLTPDGPSAGISVFAHNKHAIVTFQGVANGAYTLVLGNLLTSPVLASVSYKLLNPDNTVLASGTINQSNTALYLPKLSADGFYSIALSPGAATMTANARVITDRVVTVDGAQQPFVGTAPDQRVRLFLPLTAAQNTTLALTNLSHTTGAAGSTTSVNVYKPDGALFATTGCYAHLAVPGCRLTLANPPVTGEYVMEVVVAAGVTVNFNAWLSSELTGALAHGTPSTLQIARPGQTARITFAGTMGNSVGLEAAALSNPASHNFALNVYRPDGTLLANASPYAPSGAHLNLPNLPATGTYTVIVVPSGAFTGALQLTLDSGPMLTDASAPQAFSTTSTGETVRMMFAGNAGQHLSLALTGVTSPDTGSASAALTVYRPDGTSFASASCNSANPGGSCNAVLAADVTGTLTLGTPSSIALARAGQAARLVFAGTAGNSLGVELSAVVVNLANQYYSVTVTRPDGATLTTFNTTSTSSGGFANLSNLPATGNYTVLITPIYGITSTLQMTIDAGPTLAINGASQSFSTSVAGETVRFTFAGTTGQLLSLGLSNLVYVDASPYASSLAVVKPDGSNLGTASCTPTSPGGACSLTLPALPATGTYAVTLTTPSGIRSNGVVSLVTR